jgi:hypothetical protein
LTFTPPASATLCTALTSPVSWVPSEMPSISLFARWAGNETGECDDVPVLGNDGDVGMGKLAENEVFSRTGAQ